MDIELICPGFESRESYDFFYYFFMFFVIIIITVQIYPLWLVGWLVVLGLTAL